MAAKAKTKAASKRRTKVADEDTAKRAHPEHPKHPVHPAKPVLGQRHGEPKAEPGTPLQVPPSQQSAQGPFPKPGEPTPSDVEPAPGSAPPETRQQFVTPPATSAKDD